MRRGGASASFRVSLFTSASPREPPSFPQCTRDSGNWYDCSSGRGIVMGPLRRGRTVRPRAARFRECNESAFRETAG